MPLVPLIEKTVHESSVVTIRFESPPGFNGFPGQFVLLRATIDGDSYGRHYSISSPYTTDTFEITVFIDPEGTVSPWLAQRESGEQLEIRGPFGRNYYSGNYPVIALANGPGIGAAVGIAERAQATNTDFSIVYYNPTLVLEERLCRLAQGGQPVIYVTSELAKGISSVVDTGEVFVFGYRDFIRSVKTILEDLDKDPGVVNFENYGRR